MFSMLARVKLLNLKDPPYNYRHFNKFLNTYNPPPFLNFCASTNTICKNVIAMNLLNNVGYMQQNSSREI